jgi:hypothetical protein
MSGEVNKVSLDDDVLEGGVAARTETGIEESRQGQGCGVLLVSFRTGAINCELGLQQPTTVAHDHLLDATFFLRRILLTIGYLKSFPHGLVDPHRGSNRCDC